jgi:hypothetical protein
MKWSLRFTVSTNAWIIRDRAGRQHCWHETWEDALRCLNSALVHELTYHKKAHANRLMWRR